MKRNATLLLICFLFCIECVKAQRVTNVVLVGANGVTEDYSAATGLIVIKEFPDKHFERLDYGKDGPLKLQRAYSDSSLTTLHGRHLTYRQNGSLATRGHYAIGKKDGDWYSYNDTGKAILYQRYENDSLVESTSDFPREDTAGYKTSTFKGGAKAWLNYLKSKLTQDGFANEASKTAIAIVTFSVEPNGMIADAYVSLSAEYVIDESAIMIIEQSPPWLPATRNGIPELSKKRQPITIVKPD